MHFQLNTKVRNLQLSACDNRNQCTVISVVSSSKVLSAHFPVFPFNLSVYLIFIYLQTPKILDESIYYPYNAIFSIIFLVILADEGIFPFSEYCKLLQGLTQSPVQCEPGIISSG
jgi:hypothetical protein